MPHVAAGDEVNNVFSDVCGVIPDAFDVFRHQNKFEGGEHYSRIFHHISEQLSEELIAQAIHLVIALQHAMSEFDVSSHQGVLTIADHPFS